MDTSTVLRFIFALAFVLALIGLVAWIARRLRLVCPLVSARRATRLAVVEVLSLDQRRRLVLLRRDDREHLLLLGPSGDVVIEAGTQAPRFELPPEPPTSPPPASPPPEA
jgi:flagellar protein FliO/FliZ